MLGLHLEKETVPYKDCKEKEMVTPWEQGSCNFAEIKILCFFELVFKYTFSFLMMLLNPIKMYVQPFLLLKCTLCYGLFPHSVPSL